MLWNCAAFGVNLLLDGLNLFSSCAVNTSAVLITVVPVVFVVAYDALLFMLVSNVKLFGCIRPD